MDNKINKIAKRMIAGSANLGDAWKRADILLSAFDINQYNTTKLRAILKTLKNILKEYDNIEDFVQNKDWKELSRLEVELDKEVERIMDAETKRIENEHKAEWDRINKIKILARDVRQDIFSLNNDYGS